MHDLKWLQSDTLPQTGIHTFSQGSTEWNVGEIIATAIAVRIAPANSCFRTDELYHQQPPPSELQVELPIIGNACGPHLGGIYSHSEGRPVCEHATSSW